jgi:hypothetical protein
MTVFGSPSRKVSLTLNFGFTLGSQEAFQKIRLSCDYSDFEGRTLILKHKTNNKIHTTTTTKKDLLCRQD